MIILSAKDLTKAYGTDVILDKVSFSINKGDRVGIIGINGAGKSTLLRILTGQLGHEEGDFFISQDMKVGYLQQDTGFDSEKTVIEEINSIFDHFPEMEKEMKDLLDRASQLSETGSEEDMAESTKLLERYDLIHQRFDYMGGYAYQSEIKGILSSMAFG